MNILISNLNYTTTNEILRTVFEQFGTVASSKIIISHDTGKSKGIAIVEMPNNEEALNAITGLNNTTLDDNTIVVQQGQEITKPSNHPRPRR